MGQQRREIRLAIVGGVSLVVVAATQPASAQTAPDGTVQTQPTPPLPSGAAPQSESHASSFGGQSSLGEIVVTANKRAHSINEVPLTITVATGAALSCA